MGMIAFYAGLLIGVLFGFLFSCILVKTHAEPDAGNLSNPSEGYSQVDPLKP
jgi:hypothetical protein